MYKRPIKRPKLSGLAERKSSCSASNLENIINNEFPNGTKSTVFDSDSDKTTSSGETVKENTPIDGTFTLQSIFDTCGLSINEEPSYILNTDQAVFLRTLTSKLFSRRETYQENANRFVICFKEYHSEKANLIKSLSPTVTSTDCDVARGNTQESLIRLLLQIEEIQTELAEYLLDKLGELALENDNIDEEISSITWVRLILQPFRYLNSLVKSKKICERLFDIIFSSSADKTIQQEVIICLPDIIADTEHCHAANELSKLLQHDLVLMPSILDALTNLSLQSDIRRDVRRSLIETLRTSSIEYLPNIVKFLLFTSDTQSYDEVITGLRKELFAQRSASMSQPPNNLVDLEIDVDNIKIIVFNNIRNALLACKPLADAWLKNISQTSTTQKYSATDIIVTLILYDISTETAKKRNVETFLRNRIKNRHFTIPLIEEVFENFIPVIQEFFPALMSVLSKLLKSTDASVTDFVNTFYLSSFEKLNEDLCKMVMRDLLEYIGAGDMTDSQTALKILSNIAEVHGEKLRPLAFMLRVLLDKLIDLPLHDVEQLMDVLCSIAFGSVTEETDTMLLREDITSLIERKITSSNIKALRPGIVSAVMAIKHIAKESNEEYNVWPEKNSEDFDEHQLTDRAKKALPFLRLIIDGTRIFPEAQGLGFDQFSLMLMKCKDLDKTLLFYTSMIMKENMKKYFLICNDEVKSTDFMECVLKFPLNEEEEFVVLNLTPTLIEEMNSSVGLGIRMSSLVLAPLFRLIRGLEYEDLREIDGLLECPIMVPAPKVLDDFSLHPPEVQTIVMDSLFHLVNWFREIVNCFARLIKQPCGKKVLIRLRTLIWVQKLIAKYLPQMTVEDYCPPKCHFHRAVKPPVILQDKKKRKPTGGSDKKRKRNDDIRKHLIRQPSVSQQSSVGEESDEETRPNEKSADMKGYRQFFRELDLDIWFMLSLPLTMNPEPEKDWEFKPEFGPSELLFIMEDLVEKLHYVLISSTKKNPFKNSTNVNIGLTCSSLYTGAPEVIVKNMIKLIPRLCAHLEAVATFCQNLLTANDNILDADGMFVPETRDIKCSYSLILKALTILFSWPGFENPENEELLIVGLSKISTRVEGSQRTQRSTDIEVLIQESVSYFCKFRNTVLHLECALNLVSLVETLKKHNSHKEIAKNLGNMCWDFLSHHWYDWDGCEEKGATFNRNIEYLITTFFNCSHNKLKAVESMSDWLKEEVANLNNKDSSLNTLPNINKGNCNVLLRVVLKILAVATKESLERCKERVEKLQVWLKVMKTMDSIVDVLKCLTVRSNLICFVKGSAVILRLFVTNGITVCSELFRVEAQAVTQTLKTLQVTTRYLQKIFDNQRIKEDSALCAYAPSIRSLLESILLKVKNIMVFNGCVEAFFVGSMKNKDLQGEDILSQPISDESSERMNVDADNNEDETIEIEDDVHSNGDDSRDQVEEEENDETRDESDVVIPSDDDYDEHDETVKSRSERYS